MNEIGAVRLRDDLFALVIDFCLIIPRGLLHDYQRVGVRSYPEDRDSVLLRNVGNTYAVS